MYFPKADLQVFRTIIVPTICVCKPKIASYLYLLAGMQATLQYIWLVHLITFRTVLYHFPQFAALMIHNTTVCYPHCVKCAESLSRVLGLTSRGQRFILGKTAI